jgi:hypothetical protein
MDHGSVKTNPLYPRNCCVFMKAGGAPPAGREARPALISPSRGIPCRRGIGVRGTRYAGQLLSRKRAREATDQGAEQTHCALDTRSTRMRQQTHFIPAIAGFLWRKVVLHRAQGARLSSVRHGSRLAAIARTAPASFSRKSERKKGRIREVQNKPTSRQRRGVVLSILAKDLVGTLMDHRSVKTNPLYARNCWVFMEAGGAPPPGAQRARLSSAWHAGRQKKSDPRASHLLPQERAGEGTDLGNYQTKPNSIMKSSVFVKYSPSCLKTMRGRSVARPRAPVGGRFTPIIAPLWPSGGDRF